MKIKFKDKRQWGAQVNIPIDGIVAIGKAGVTEVSEKAAALLINKSTDWEEIPGQKTVTKPTKATDKTVKSGSKKTKIVEPEDEEIEDETLDQTESEEADEVEIDEDDPHGLNQMDLENLINIAQTSEILGWEKFKHNEKALRTYLKNRLES